MPSRSCLCFLTDRRACGQVIGTPTDEELVFIRNEDARKYMRHLPQYPRRPFASLFPKVHPVALDLIERMLTFNPLQRITGERPAAARQFQRSHGREVKRAAFRGVRRRKKRPGALGRRPGGGRGFPHEA